ncbi:hypothetical protein HMPREF3024_14875 [Achromobacter xylosoxidans]|nr:hypothetical protein HMPREF3024_14875 [Achromobacter xylosoxidans]
MKITASGRTGAGRAAGSGAAGWAWSAGGRLRTNSARMSAAERSERREGRGGTGLPDAVVDRQKDCKENPLQSVMGEAGGQGCLIFK